MVMHISLLLAGSITILIFIPAVKGQAQCSNDSLQADATVMYITSPGYPNNYSNNVDCEWYISTLSSKVIILTVLNLYTEENSFSCSYADYVAVYDGTNSSSTRLQLLCGQVSNVQITSSGPYMTIVFHSGSSNSNTRFRLQYTSSEKTDIRLSATATVNYFTSPGYPNNYTDDFDCEWHITSYLASDVVVLRLVDFNIEDSSLNCTTRDYVTIYDGSSSYSPQLKILCGQVLNATVIISTGYSMTVKFHSDSSVNNRGFKFEYMSQNKSAQCTNVNLQADVTMMNITSPGYPNNYPNNVDCQWYISTSLSKVIVLTVIDFIMEGNQPSCIYDYVAVYDGSSTSSTRLQLMCDRVYYTQIKSSGPYMTIVFHSDSSRSNTGFRLQYTSSENADVSLSATATANYITSPGYPNNYPNYFDRQWYITTNSISNVVVLRSLDFYIAGSMPSCTEDYVTIYDGGSSYYPQLTKLCGQILNTTLISSGSFMTVKFHSDSFYNYRGFKFEYTSQTKSDISLSATASVNNLTSPDYPYSYPNNLDRQWYITTNLYSNVIVLKLVDFYTEGSTSSCTRDYVTIYDGSSIYSPQLRILCGQVSNVTVISTGSSMTVKFHSDSSYNYRGFKFEYVSQSNNSVHCRDVSLEADITANYITSPGYPNDYPNDVDCQWRISTLPLKVILLTVLNLNLEGSLSSCSYDYVAVYDGTNSSSTRLQLLCGQVSYTQVTSSGPYMTIVFHSDSSTRSAGFRLQYTSSAFTDISLSATASVNYLTSPGYPNNYPDNLDRQWYITSNLYSNVVVMRLVDFYTEGSMPSCASDYVTIYDGSSSYSSQLTKLCGQISSTTVISTGNSMTVKFHSDSSVNFRGFKFEYTSQSKSDISLSATTTMNYLTSPGYPSNYPDNLDRQWYITSNLYSNVVVLKLVDFNTEGSMPSCASDYVAIYDGSSFDSSQLTKLCGQISSTTVISTGNSMTVKFHSDSSINFRGFKFEYTSQSKSVQCGDDNLWADETAKNINSPGYPRNYPNNSDCQWQITASSSKVVKLEMLSFRLEGGTLCSYDYVAVYDGPSTMSNQIAKLCGNLYDRTIESTGSDMTVVFHSDGTNSYGGFSFAYSSKEKNAGLSGGIIAAIVICCIAVPIIILAIVIYARRMSAKNGARNTQSRVTGPNSGRVITSRENGMFFVSQPNMNPTAPYDTNVGIVNSQGALNPPPYASLNLNVNSGMPPYPYSGSGYAINNPPDYSNIFPNGAAYQEQKSGAHVNSGFTSSSSDEAVAGQSVSENVYTTVDTPVNTSTATEAKNPNTDSN